MKKLILSVLVITNLFANEIPIDKTDIKYTYNEKSNSCYKTPGEEIERILSLIKDKRLLTSNIYEIQGGMTTIVKSLDNSQVYIFANNPVSCASARDALSGN